MKTPNGPIIYVEDDPDDQAIFRDIVQSFHLPNDILFFENGREFLDYIYIARVQPLLIFCDINMPVMNGFELRKTIMDDERLKKKSIPFIFYTTSINKQEIDLAYELTVQGYFEKASDVDEIAKTLRMVIDYWCVCKHPNSMRS